MEQFSLEKYLENPSYKVLTRRGNPVRIICTDRKHGEDELPIVFLEQCRNGEFLLACRKDGRCDNYDTQYDLFFADEENELTEFEKVLKEVIEDVQNGDYIEEESFDFWKDRLIDLARKELQPEFDKEMDKMLAETDKVVYQKGQQDTLKSLPKLEKTKDCIDPTIPIMYTNTPSMKSYVEYHGYKLCINDVFEKLPKEEL